MGGHVHEPQVFYFFRTSKSRFCSTFVPLNWEVMSPNHRFKSQAAPPKPAQPPQADAAAPTQASIHAAGTTALAAKSKQQQRKGGGGGGGGGQGGEGEAASPLDNSLNADEFGADTLSDGEVLSLLALLVQK